MKTADKEILNKVLDLARKTLQYPALSQTQKRTLIYKSSVVKTQINNLTPIRKGKVLSFIYLLTGEHPIFESPRFLSPNLYHPLDLKSYNAFHKIPSSATGSNIHGNNYLYLQTNLRNGVLFTYHDIETNSYIPVTFNTNFPIFMIAPDPFCINGDNSEVLERMFDYFYLLSKRKSLKSFPIIVKGLDRETADSLDRRPNATKITQDPDITTITAEMNFPALSYDIGQLKKMVTSQTYDKTKNSRKPKLISTVKKLDSLTYHEEWQFDKEKTLYIAQKWAYSKIARLKRRGIQNIDNKYMINTVIKSIGEMPPGKRNKDFFTIAIKAKTKQGRIAPHQLLGVVIASKNNKTVGALNAVVVPVQKSFRELGYYSVYKLVEKMYNHGITSYWHGPKELISDVSAVIEFMGTPDKIEKKYCLRYRIEKPTKVRYQELNSVLTPTISQAAI